MTIKRSADERGNYLFYQPFSESFGNGLPRDAGGGDSIVKTVMDALKEAGGRGVVVQRHGAYMTGHVKARLIAEGMSDLEEVDVVLLARNYARREPDWMWPLTFEAIQECHVQGSRFALAGMRPVEIIGSNSGRGPHTGQAISEGFARMTNGGIWIPFRCDAAVDYPVYDYDEVHDALWTSPDVFVGEWLNDKRPELVPNETPEQFERRVMDFILTIVLKPDVRVITTHFEILALVHALCVAKQKRGQIDETWVPEKNGGVVLWVNRNGRLMAADYNTPDYNLVGKPVEVSMKIAFGWPND